MQKIEELLEQFKSILLAEQYIEEVKNLLKNKKEERLKLIAGVDAIADKLEDKEGFSVKNLFKQTLVDEEKQHDIEKQEYLMLALKYKDCTEVINILEYEFKILKEKVANKDNVETNLTFALDEEQKKTQDLIPRELKRLLETNDKIKDCINFKREIYEAHLVALKIKETLGIMHQHLRNAKKFDRWGEFYAEIQEGKALKKAHMDQAHSVSHQVGVLMQKLGKELKDIYDYRSKTKMLSYEELLHFQDGFHEAIITDWVVSNDVVSVLANVNSSVRYIQRIIHSLQLQKEKTNGLIQKFKDKRNIIIEAL